MKQIFSFCLLLLLLYSEKINAQVVFNDPTPNPVLSAWVTVRYSGTSAAATTSQQIPRPSAGTSLAMVFDAKVFRNKNTTTAGYVDLFAGNGSNSLDATPLTGSRVQVTQWLPVRDVQTGQPGTYEYAVVTSPIFNLTSVQAGTYTGLYAVYHSTVANSPQVDVSPPVLLTPPPTNPTTTTSNNPCGNNQGTLSICFDQCVSYGTRPAELTGPTVMPQVQSNYTYVWQISYTNNWWDWQDVKWGYVSYTPEACLQTTYYRRKLMSVKTDMWGDVYHDEVGISNTVTITPQSIPPVPVQSTVTACTQATAVALAVNPVAPAVSYNWWVPYAGWGVSNDGLNPFSTYNQNGSFVTTRTNVVITLPPGGVAPGTYPIAISTNGACGGQTADAIINIVISSTAAAPTPTSATFVKASTSTQCAPVYNLKTPVVAGATSYTASDAYGSNVIGTIVQNTTGVGQSVLFELNQEGPAYDYTATITATGPCGTGFFTTPATNLAGPSPKCGLMRSASVSTDLYPNPASDKVTIVTDGKEGKVVFYDAMGVARKTVTLLAGASQSDISVQDLSGGLYHVQVIIPGQAPFNKQLIVQP